MPKGSLTVIKLGGSQALGPHLQQWLASIVAAAGRTIVVPGGGPFADAVRLAQSHMGFDDDAAHHLALIAMEQYGRALCALRSQLVLSCCLEEVQNALERGQIPVWGPVRMALAATALPASWELTSDSLAAWLAGLIGADHLVLVKQIHFQKDSMAAADLVAQGVVDSLFPRFLSQSRARAWLTGPDTAARPTAIVLDTDATRPSPPPNMLTVREPWP
jgi:5-(aminomethyl)-3-furanmethanol phosphate kinase